MLFNSVGFLLFFGLVFSVYWKIPRKRQWVLLLVASYYFYASWKPAYLLLIVFSTVVNYVAALAMARDRTRKVVYLVGALAANFGLLFVFKYLNFFGYSLSYVLTAVGAPVALPEWKILLPVGISFYTFQTTAYVIDVFQGKIKPEKHLGYFALFVSFFPQLVAGPIERSKELLPQLKKSYRFDYQRAVSGLKLFGVGLFKKMVIADNLALVVNRVFGNLGEFKGLSLLVAVVLFSWQIYCDFSGYTDMARGVARMLGFFLVENFDRPYLATSIRDFWRRWHMSLSNWLKDYLYIPLSGSRKGIWRTGINYLIVFTLCGLWHGAAWHFVVWGAVHGAFISAERLVGQFSPWKIKVPRAVAVVYSYSLVCASWVLFRAETLGDAWYIYRNSLVGLTNLVNPGYVWASLSQVFVTNRLEMAVALFCLGAVVVEHWALGNQVWRQVLDRQKLVVRFVIYGVFLMLLVHLRDAKISEFIYFRF